MILRVDLPTFSCIFIHLGNGELVHSSPFSVKYGLCNIKCKLILHFQIVLLLLPPSPERRHPPVQPHPSPVVGTASHSCLFS